MAKRPAKLIVMFLILGAFLSCNSVKPLGSGPFKVQIPWAERGQDYSLQNVEIHTLKNPVGMEGDAAKIRVNQKTDEKPPEAHFTQIGDGVIVPNDSMSAQLFAVYAHMERLFFLEVELGISHLIPRPRLVSIDSKVLDGAENKAILDNATFVGSLDLLAIMPLSSNSLPITMNGGVLAHEQFHGIFYHLVLKGLPQSDLKHWAQVRDEWGHDHSDFSSELKILKEKTSKAETSNSNLLLSADVTANQTYNNTFILQALNEGFADYWGWLYSGDNNFIVRSIPVANNQRVILNRAQALPTDVELDQLMSKGSAQNPQELVYFLGTHYASIMRNLSETEGRLPTAKLLVSSLKNLKSHWETLDHRQKVSSGIIFDILFPKGQKMTPSQCCVVRQALGAMATSGYSKRCESLQGQCN
jgi:hypothetical protein